MKLVNKNVSKFIKKNSFKEIVIVVRISTIFICHRSC